MSGRLYFMDEAHLTVPEGYRDRSTNILEWETGPGTRIVLVVQRDQIDPEAIAEPRSPALALADYVAGATGAYPTAFAGYKLERDEVAVGLTGGVEKRRIAYRWHQEAEVIYHHQAFILTGTAILVFTAGGKARDRERIDHLIDAAIADLRYRAD